MAAYNGRFGREPANGKDVHRPLVSGEMAAVPESDLAVLAGVLGLPEAAVAEDAVQVGAVLDWLDSVATPMLHPWRWRWRCGEREWSHDRAGASQ